MKVCTHCGNVIDEAKQLFPLEICGACQMRNLARFVEMEIPEDTVREIAEGEQCGAAMRECADWIDKSSRFG